MRATSVPAGRFRPCSTRRVDSAPCSPSSARCTPRHQPDGDGELLALHEGFEPRRHLTLDGVETLTPGGRTFGHVRTVPRRTDPHIPRPRASVPGPSAVDQPIAKTTLTSPPGPGSPGRRRRWRRCRRQGHRPPSRGRHRRVHAGLDDPQDLTDLDARCRGVLPGAHRGVGDRRGPRGLQHGLGVGVGEGHALQRELVTDERLQRVDDVADLGAVRADVVDRRSHAGRRLVAGDPLAVVAVRREQVEPGRLDVLGGEPVVLQRVDERLGLRADRLERLGGGRCLRLHAARSASRRPGRRTPCRGR